MNVIRSRQEKRRLQIIEIKGTLLELKKKKELQGCYDKVVLGIMSGVNLSRSTAQDYLDVAIYELDFNKDVLKYRDYTEEKAIK